VFRRFKLAWAEAMMLRLESPWRIHAFTGTEEHFAGDHDVLTAFAQGPTEDHLRLSVGVPVGGVEEIDARLEAAVHHLFGEVLINFVDGFDVAASEGHRAEREFRDD
jgi:hypothetical protein